MAQQRLPFLRLLCNFDIDDPWQWFAQLQFSCSALWVTLPEVLLCLSTKELSPIEHVGNSFIPALFLHGVEDDPCQQIYDMLQLNEVRRSLEATWEMQGARDREAEKQHIICWGFYTSTPLAKTLWGRLSLQLFDELSQFMSGSNLVPFPPSFFLGTGLHRGQRNGAAFPQDSASLVGNVLCMDTWTKRDQTSVVFDGERIRWSLPGWLSVITIPTATCTWSASRRLFCMTCSGWFPGPCPVVSWQCSDVWHCVTTSGFYAPLWHIINHTLCNCISYIK